MTSNDLQQNGDVARILFQYKDFFDKYYEDISFVGQGSQGMVLKAYNKSMKEYQALKLLPGIISAKDEKRFLQEVLTLANLDHKNIIKIKSANSYHGTTRRGKEYVLHYMAMEYIDGENLMLYLHNKKPSLDTLQYIFSTLATTLHYAHENNYAHRDIKPENIIIDTNGIPYLADFGSVKILDALKDAQLTSLNEMIGTRQYIAPEFFKKNSASLDFETLKLADQFSLGITMYYCLSGGYTPYTGISEVELIKQISNGDRIPLQHYAPDTPSSLIEIYNKATALDKHQRFPDCNALTDALKQYHSISEPKIASITYYYKNFITPLCITACLASLIGNISFLYLQNHLDNNINKLENKNLALQNSQVTSYFSPSQTSLPKKQSYIQKFLTKDSNQLLVQDVLTAYTYSLAINDVRSSNDIVKKILNVSSYDTSTLMHLNSSSNFSSILNTHIGLKLLQTSEKLFRSLSKQITTHNYTYTSLLSNSTPKINSLFTVKYCPTTLLKNKCYLKLKKAYKKLKHKKNSHSQDLILTYQLTYSLTQLSIQYIEPELPHTHAYGLLSRSYALLALLEENRSPLHLSNARTYHEYYRLHTGLEVEASNLKKANKLYKK